MQDGRFSKLGNWIFCAVLLLVVTVLVLEFVLPENTKCQISPDFQAEVQLRKFLKSSIKVDELRRAELEKRLEQAIWASRHDKRYQHDPRVMGDLISKLNREIASTDQLIQHTEEEASQHLWFTPHLWNFIIREMRGSPTP